MMLAPHIITSHYPPFALISIILANLYYGTAYCFFELYPKSMVRKSNSEEYRAGKSPENRDNYPLRIL